MSDNITPLPQIEHDKLVAAVEQLRRNLPHLVEYHKLDAKMKKAKYDALVAEGFHPVQALELCR